MAASVQLNGIIIDDRIPSDLTSGRGSAGFFCRFCWYRIWERDVFFGTGFDRFCRYSEKEGRGERKEDFV
jgi:hypothetical protein